MVKHPHFSGFAAREPAQELADTRADALVDAPLGRAASDRGWLCPMRVAIVESLLVAGEGDTLLPPDKSCRNGDVLLDKPPSRAIEKRDVHSRITCPIGTRVSVLQQTISG